MSGDHGGGSPYGDPRKFQDNLQGNRGPPSDPRAFFKQETVKSEGHEQGNGANALNAASGQPTPPPGWDQILNMFNKASNTASGQTASPAPQIPPVSHESTPQFSQPPPTLSAPVHGADPVTMLLGKLMQQQSPVAPMPPNQPPAFGVGMPAPVQQQPQAAPNVVTDNSFLTTLITLAAAAKQQPQAQTPQMPSTPFSSFLTSQANPQMAPKSAPVTNDPVWRPDNEYFSPQNNIQSSGAFSNSSQQRSNGYSPGAQRNRADRGHDRGYRGRERGFSPRKRYRRDESRSPPPRRRNHSRESRDATNNERGWFRGLQAPEVVDKGIGEWIFSEGSAEVDRNEIKVITRTLYIGGVTPDLDKEELTKEVQSIGPLTSILISYPQRHAFLKLRSRAVAQKVKNHLDRRRVSGCLLKISWGCGFGPRPLFQYEEGASCIPIDRLSKSDRYWLMESDFGGIRQGTFRGGIVCEEPDVVFYDKAVTNDRELRELSAQVTFKGGRRKENYRRRDDHRDRGNGYRRRSNSGRSRSPNRQPGESPPSITSRISFTNGAAS